jgi:acylphosphatase
VERVATEPDLDGYVKNRADGSVEVYASGTERQLSELRQQLWTGPGLSRVEEVEEAEADPELRTGFRVEH